MRKTHLQTDPVLDSILRIMETVTILGLTYCILLLTGLLDMANVTTNQVLVYGGWFITAAISVHAMLSRARWGAYALAAATLIVTIYEFATNNATLAGATLGLIVIVIIVAYLYPFRPSPE